MRENPQLYYEFGAFKLDEKERRLLRDGDEVTINENGRTERLTPKAFDLLLLLVKRSGEMVGRDELMERIWPDTFVEDNRLSDNISILRKYLGDRAKNPQYIETIPKHGYRFVGDVREVHDQTFAILNQTRTHIVIEEEGETTPVSQSSTPAFPELATPPLLTTGVPRGRATRLSILLVVGLVGVLSLIAYFAVKSLTTPPAAPALPRNRIAVLPFKPLAGSGGGDRSLELGMTDAIIARLSNIGPVIVRPTNSVMKYTNDGQDLRAIGSELGVDVLLDGRVQREGDRIRLSLQLVRTVDGATVWADKFDEKFTDIFTVQDVIAERVATALAVKLTSDEKKALAKRYTDNLQAYEFYLSGRQHWSTFTPAGREASINYYNEALKLDPNFALAYTGLANSYIVMGIYGPPSPAEIMPKAREAVQRALKLDPELAEAHIAAGALKIFYERDWNGAQQELKLAMKLKPNDADAHSLYGYSMQAIGQFEEAIASMRRAKSLAPQWHIPEVDLLESLFFARRYDEAIEQARQRTRLEPNSGHGYYELAKALTQKGLYNEAVAELQRGITYPGMREHMKGRLIAELGYTYALSGNREQAMHQLRELEGDSDPWRPLQLAKIYAGLGDQDQAFISLTKAVDARFPFAFHIRTEPHFDNLRSDSRYSELLRRMNLQP